MNQDLLDIVRIFHGKDVEIQIALQCAPLIAGLKPSNLLMVQNHNLDQLEHILKKCGITYDILADTGQRTAVLLFDWNRLAAYLKEKKVWQFFRRVGYPEASLGKVLPAFRLRYEDYLSGKQDFPHEMGLLLGYPVEDVEGFIDNEGEDCLFTGYWKVYQDPGEKRLLFRKFERVREILLRLLSDGWELSEIVKRKWVLQNII